MVIDNGVGVFCRFTFRDGINWQDYFCLKKSPYLAGNLCPYELFCMVEARLDQVGQVVMLSSTNEA